MIGIIILAAGASSRLGSPKQLLQHQGTTLLNHSINAALEIRDAKVIVVLGAHIASINKTLPDQPFHCVTCMDWEKGMSASIKTGINALKCLVPEAAAALLMLCDQPLISGRLLNEMITAKESSGKKIIASAYNDTLGAPMLIDHTLFSALQLLNGQQGAKVLVNKYPDEVMSVPFPDGAIDIDTMDDYKLLAQHL